MQITRSVDQQIFVIAGFKHDRVNALIYNKSIQPKSIAKKVELTLMNPEGADVISIRRAYQSVGEAVTIPDLPPDTLEKYTGRKMPLTIRDVLIEELAAIEHEQWQAWSKDIASKEQLSPERLQRWQSYWVPYEQLPEDTKEQDRIWARKAVDNIFSKRA